MGGSLSFDAREDLVPEVHDVSLLLRHGFDRSSPARTGPLDRRKKPFYRPRLGLSYQKPQVSGLKRQVLAISVEFPQFFHRCENFGDRPKTHGAGWSSPRFAFLKGRRL